MASMSQHATSYRGVRGRPQQLQAPIVPLSRVVGSGVRATSPHQQSQNTSTPVKSARPSSPAHGQSTYAITTLPVSSTSSRPTSPAPPTPFTPSPTKPTSGQSSMPAYSQRRGITLLLTAILTSACFGVTAWFAQATFSSTSFSQTRDFFRSHLRIDLGDTLTVLALLSGLLTFLMGIVLDAVLEVVQWALTCRDQGVSISSVLAISSTTGALGTLGIITGKGPEAGARVWAAAKMALRFSIWVSGVILFVNTSVGTIYRSTYTYRASAGIGPFDGSLVDPYRQSLSFRNLDSTDDVVPYTSSAVAFNLIVNSMHSVNSDHTNCNNETCDSYTLPGGLMNSAPLPPDNLTDDPVILLDSVPSYRIDFARDATEPLNDEDCDVYWQHPWLIAIRFCVAPSSLQQGSVHVAFEVCAGGTVGSTCLYNSTPPAGMASTFSLYALTTSLVVSRSNYSILSISKASAAVPDYSLDVPAYREALRWLLNFTASGIPAPSSAVEYFWASPEELGSDYWSVGSRQAFQSLLAYPLWFFNVNNAGNLNWNRKNTTLVLPDEFYTDASVASPFTKIVVNKATFVVFVVLQSIILCCAWATILALWIKPIRLPKISSYPIFCFAFKTEDPSTPQVPASPVSTLFGPGYGAHAGDTEVRTAVAGRRIRFRDTIPPAPPFGSWLSQSTGLSQRKRRGKYGLVNTMTP